LQIVLFDPGNYTPHYVENLPVVKVKPLGDSVIGAILLVAAI
jgi:hypothetical protein